MRIISLEAFLDNHSLRSQARRCYHPPLMIEVAENDVESLPYFPEHVRCGNPRTIKNDVCCSCCGRIRCFDRLRRNIVRAGNKEDKRTLLEMRRVRSQNVKRVVRTSV